MTVWVIEVQYPDGQWKVRGYGKTIQGYNTWQQANRDLSKARRKHPKAKFRRATYRRVEATDAL